MWGMLNFDLVVQKVSNEIDKKIKDTAKYTPREVTPNQICNVKTGAMPVSYGLKAAQIAAMEVAFRVMPNEVEDYIDKTLTKMATKIGNSILSKVVTKGFLLAIFNELFTATKKMDAADHLDLMIEKAVGCGEGGVRQMVANDINEMKLRTSHEPRKMKKVHTRRK
jgi:hypothetical protein